MPIDTVTLTGNQIVAMANVSRADKYTFTANPATTALFEFNELAVVGLPSLMYWIRLDDPVAGVIFRPVFSVENITAGTAPVPAWAPFTNGSILVPTNVTVFTIRAAVSMMAAQITLPPGVGSVNFSVILTAGG